MICLSTVVTGRAHAAAPALAPALALALAVGAAPACTKAAEEHATPVPAAAAAGTTGGAAAFLADDWQEARRLAGGKLVFVDAWAPWCHTCWSMKREVLHDPSLAAFADRFVFAEIDTDKPQNAAFATRFPVRVWPTFFAIDPTSETIVATKGGSMSLQETHAFLEEAWRARSGGGPVDLALAAGYRALQGGDALAAAAHFEEAGKLPSARRAEALGAAVRALRQAKDVGRCATVAADAMDVVDGGAAGDLASYVLLCAEGLPDADPRKRAVRERAQKRLEAIVAAASPGVTVDDRADFMATLAELYEAMERKADAVALHERRLALLEADAKAARTAEEARTHDYARMNSYLALGRGEEAVALFQGRMRQLPDDYEVHARLAATLSRLERFEEALPAAERAVALSYGPRQLRYLMLLADVRARLGDRPAERAALEELVRSNAALPAPLRLDDLAAKATERLAAPEQAKPLVTK
jgi:tetratricopeptide (TPR) repeat protein